MAQAQKVGTELIAEYFVNYLFDDFKGVRHVRRVATWIGFLLKAIEKLPGVSFTRSRSRQLTFEYRDRRFKVRYSHKIKPRGGIEFIEVLSGRGAPEGKPVLSVGSLSGAETTYHDLRKTLDKFIVA